MTEPDSSPPAETVADGVVINPFEATIHSITVEVKQDSFTHRWNLTTAAVGTLSRLVAWGMLLFLSLHVLPAALANLADQDGATPREALASIAWLELLQPRRWALWIGMLVLLGMDFMIRLQDSRETRWRLWLWNLFTFWLAIGFWVAFFGFLIFRLI